MSYYIILILYIYIYSMQKWAAKLLAEHRQALTVMKSTMELLAWAFWLFSLCLWQVYVSTHFHNNILIQPWTLRSIRSCLQPFFPANVDVTFGLPLEINKPLNQKVFKHLDKAFLYPVKSGWGPQLGGARWTGLRWTPAPVLPHLLQSRNPMLPGRSLPRKHRH